MEQTGGRNPEGVPAVHGPVTTGAGRAVLGAGGLDLGPLGYVEHEFFVEGTARTFTSDSPLSSDGRSLVPLLTGDVARVRTALLVEHCRGSTVLCPGTGMLLLQRNVPGYWGVVTARYKYVRYGTGEVELYDLLEDPWEGRNRAAWPAYASIKDDLDRKLDWLRSLAPT